MFVHICKGWRRFLLRANIVIVSPLQVIVFLVSSEHDDSQVGIALACGMLDTASSVSCIS